jgi:hypothetical protein
MGTLEESDFYELRAVMRYWLRGPGCHAWWEKIGRESFGPEFARFVDSELELLAAENKRAEA